jgi:phage replication O-like protein O
VASPQLENGFLRLSNELAEALMRAPLNGSQCRIMLAVVREAYGRNGGKKAAPLSLRRIAAMTNIDLRRVRRETTSLLKASLIFRQQESDSRTLYGVSKDYERWRIDKRRPRGGGESAHGGQLALGASPPTGEGVNPPPKEGANLPTHRRKECKEKLRARKARAADPRFQPFVELAFKAYEEKHGVKPTWTGEDFRALKELLKANERLELAEFQTIFANYLDSDVRFYRQKGYRLKYACGDFDGLRSGPVHDGGRADGNRGGSLWEKNVEAGREFLRRRGEVASRDGANV